MTRGASGTTRRGRRARRRPPSRAGTRARPRRSREWPARHGPCSAACAQGLHRVVEASGPEGSRNTGAQRNLAHTSAIGRSDRARSRCATVHRYGGRPMPKPWRSTAGVGGDVGRVDGRSPRRRRGSRAGGGVRNGRHPAKHLRVCVACRVLCSSAAAPLTASMPRDEVFSGLVTAAAPAAQQVQRPTQRLEDAAAAVPARVVAALATPRLPGVLRLLRVSKTMFFFESRRRHLQTREPVRWRLGSPGGRALAAGRARAAPFFARMAPGASDCNANF